MISKDEIKHLGWLSRLELTEEEISKYAFQIKEIVGYLDKLDSISLTEIEPVRSKKKISELRKDHVKPFTGDGFIKGPRLI